MFCTSTVILRESEHVTRHIRCELPAHTGSHAAVVDGKTVLWGDT